MLYIARGNLWNLRLLKQQKPGPRKIILTAVIFHGDAEGAAEDTYQPKLKYDKFQTFIQEKS